MKSSRRVRSDSAFFASVAALMSVLLLGAKMTIPGALIYSTGTDLVRVDFTSGRPDVIYRDGGTLGSAISRVSENTFVVSNDRGELRLVFPGDSVVLGRGASPLYLPAHRTLFYYLKSVEDHGPRLLSATLKGSTIGQVREIDAGPFGSSPPVQAISDDEILFYRPDGSGTRAFVYNARNGSTRALPIFACRPVSWIKARERLVCTDQGRVWMVRLDGTNKVELSKLRGISVGPSSPAGDRLLGSRGRLGSGLRGEVFDLVAYDIDGDTLEPIVENVALVNGTGLWLTD